MNLVLSLLHIALMPVPKGKKFYGNRRGRGGIWMNLGDLKKYLLKELNPAPTIIMDNAVFHKKEAVHAMTEAEGHRVLFLPPYSLDLNPIEQYFAILKKNKTECSL